MNIENDFLTDFDLFGKVPELYYKGKSKKSSTFGLVLTILYIILYIAFLIYKLIRMFKRVDMTFYDSYTFQGLPSWKDPPQSRDSRGCRCRRPSRPLSRIHSRQ